MKIVGHRGARGLVTENTVESIQAAAKLPIDGIEFDVRKTADNELVLCHDRNIYFYTGQNKMVDELSLDQLRKLRHHDGKRFPTLQEAVVAAGRIPTIIEIKQLGCAELVVKLMNRPKNRDRVWYVTSQLREEIAVIRRLRPDVKTLVSAEISHPFKVIGEAIQLGAWGISINVWVLSLLNYAVARRNNLNVMVYVFRPTFLLTNRFSIWFLNTIYRDLYICTDRPDKLVKFSKRRR